MKIKTALIICLSLLFSFSGITYIDAQTSFEGDTGGVDVNANIDQDLYSQLEISPTYVEILQPTTVNLHLLNSNNEPKANRTIILYINGSSSGVSITQPLKSDSNGNTSGSVKSSLSGTYTICAKDITEGFDIYLSDCENLYVIPVAIPTLNAEPAFTQGSKNTLSWNTSGLGTYMFLAQSSTKSDFSTTAQDTGWITSRSYEFTDLTNGQMYFYRVKAKNSWGGESGWSNVVYSVQDNTAPEVKLLSTSGLGTTTTQNWDAQTILTFKLRVKDNIQISEKSFWCVLQDGSSKECLNTESLNGDIWTLTVRLGDLEHDSNYFLYSTYNFCAQASDEVGNVTRICNISLKIPETSPSKPVNPATPIVEQIKDTVVNIIEDTQKIANNTIGSMDTGTLEQISITVTLGNILLGIGMLLGGIGTLPYIIVQLFLSILGILGFRRKGKPTGYLYDSVTKEPISQGIVRIFNENNELVWTDVTNHNGYFETVEVPSGEYSIKVMAKDYDFPSKIVFGKKDFPFENVYQGQEFYTSSGVIPDFSIPMDLRKMGEFRRIFNQLAFGSKILWKTLYFVFFVFGFIFSIYALITNRIWYNYIILLLYIPSLLIFFASFLGNREKFGIVKDIKGKRLEGITLGLKEREFGKLVSKRVTDSHGRYRFFVNKGSYELVVLSTDWKLVDENMGIVDFKKDGILTKRIVLKKVVTEKKIKKIKQEEEVLEPLEEL